MCCSALQCVAVCCSVLQCVAVCCSEYLFGLVDLNVYVTECHVTRRVLRELQGVAECCGVLQCVEERCSVLQCEPFRPFLTHRVSRRVPRHIAHLARTAACSAWCCRALQCVAVCCSVLRYVAECTFSALSSLSSISQSVTSHRASCANCAAATAICSASLASISAFSLGRTPEGPVAVCCRLSCSVLLCVADLVAVCCSVLQCVAMRCSVLQPCALPRWRPSAPFHSGAAVCYRNTCSGCRLSCSVVQTQLQNQMQCAAVYCNVL